MALASAKVIISRDSCTQGPQCRTSPALVAPRPMEPPRQLVRPSAWRVGSAVERLVGRGSAVPRTPVFVLTDHAREPRPMDGGTTCYVVTERA